MFYLPIFYHPYHSITRRNLNLSFKKFSKITFDLIFKSELKHIVIGVLYIILQLKY